MTMDSGLDAEVGPYRIIEELGSGGMASVYKAYQSSMDRFVALKVMHRQYATDEEFVARFDQEAKVIAKLEHPNIIPIFDYGKTEDTTYIAMRYLETGTLEDRMDGSPLSFELASQVINQIGGALSYSHSLGVIHRDVKPSNVLIDKHGNCFLTDFGFAKMLESQVKLSLVGSALGTPPYMSPEQILGQPLDGRSDIYSLGIVLYEMLVGHPPYEGETPSAILVKHINEELPPPRSYNAQIPEFLEWVIFKALAKNPADRFSTIDEFIRAVNSSMDGHAPPVPASAQKAPAVTPIPGYPVAQKTTGLRKRHILLPTVVIAAILFPIMIVVLGLSGIFIRAQQTRQNATATQAHQELLDIQNTATAEILAREDAEQASQTAAAATQNAATATQNANIALQNTGTAAALVTPEATDTETPTPTSEIASGTISLRECRGLDGTLFFGNNPPQSFHAFSTVSFTAVGAVRIRIEWVGRPDLNVDITVVPPRHLQFGDACQ